MGIVKNQQLHPRPIRLQVTETPDVTLFMQQANNKVVIALAVLQRIAARRGRLELQGQCLDAGKDGVGLLMFAEDLFDDVRHGQVLKHAGGPAVAQQGERRFHG